MPDVPALPEGLVVRPLRDDDLEAVAVLLEAAEAVDDTGAHEDADDLREWLVNDFVDLARDTLAVLTGEGAVVGVAVTVDPGSFRDAYRVILDGRVHPAWRGRGIGRALLSWQLARGAELHAARAPEAPAKLSVEAWTTMPSLEALLRRAGLEQTRWYFHLQRALAEVPPPRPVPGVEVVPFAWDRDDEVRRAHNAAFADHYGSADRDEVAWRTWYTGVSAFRPDLSRLALGDGAVVGYALVYVYEADTRATGVPDAYFGQIGVFPGARGRGLATAVIAASLHAAAAAGCGTASLQVDSENGTGALRLYERLGFARRRTSVSWARSLPPVG